ncbi:MAG: TlpA family protein disulfide reductase, partial [Candidatus Limnocylindria bacterium]
SNTPVKGHSVLEVQAEMATASGNAADALSNQKVPRNVEKHIRGYFDQLGLTAVQPLLDVNSETSRRYALASVPSTFFVDAAGVIRHLYIGELDDDKLAAGLRKIAAQ